MTTISAALRSMLLNESDVTDIIGNRLYPLTFPARATMPLMVYRVIYGAHVRRAADNTIDKMTRFQLDTWAREHSETQEMKEALATLFDSYNGTVNGHVIIDTKIDLEFELYESETALYRYSCDVSIDHEGA